MSQRPITRPVAAPAPVSLASNYQADLTADNWQDRETRATALSLAVTNTYGGLPAKDTVERAEAYYAFLSGQKA